MVSDAGKMDRPAAEFDEEQHIHPPQEDRVDGEKVARDDPAACWRRNTRQVVAIRRGAGSMPRACSTRLIELAEIWQPRRSSSPRIRW